MNFLSPLAAQSTTHTRRQDLQAAKDHFIHTIRTIAIACLALCITFCLIKAALRLTNAGLYRIAQSGAPLETQQIVQFMSQIGIGIIGWAGVRETYLYARASLNPMRNTAGYLAFAALGREENGI